MKTENAVVLTGDSIPNESLDTAAKAVAQILRSQEPADELLATLIEGSIPDQIGQELVEVFDEIVKVPDFDNLVEIIDVLQEDGMISTPTAKTLLLAIVEMAGQGETVQQATEPGSAEMQAPVNGLRSLVRQATELLQQFGTPAAVPDEGLGEIRQAVQNLTAEEFAALRQSLGSAILVQAESEKEVDVSASLRVVEILLGQRQSTLIEAAFTVYKTLFQGKVRLRDRDKFDRPLMTILSLTFLRNRFRNWLDVNKACLGEKELETAEKEVTKLEKFLMAAGYESLREAIWNDLSNRRREKIISNGIGFVNFVNYELAADQPQTKEAFLAQANGYLESAAEKLGYCLQHTGGKTLGEAEATLDEILSGLSFCKLWRNEYAKLELLDYNPASQQPELSAAQKRLAFFETERKELDSIRIEIGEQIELAKESRGSKATLKKLGSLQDITLRKIAELDQCIAPLQPKRTPINGTNGIPLPPVPSSSLIFPPALAVPALVESNPVFAKEASHG